MPFKAAYRRIEDRVVAIVQKFHDSNQSLPTVLGTGFLVSQHGLVCTCKHVVEKCLTLPKPADYQGLPFAVYLFREVAINNQPRWAYFPLDVIDAQPATFEGGRPSYIGRDLPDVSLLLLNVRGTSSVSFSDEPVAIGENLAFAGFPMGTGVLKGHVGFQQESPSLHSGIVSAIFPNRLAQSPYGFLLHANTQTGASGSPVFRYDGTVVGMLYMGFDDEYSDGGPEDPKTRRYDVPTALSGCISGRLIAQAVALADSQSATFNNRPLLEDQIATATQHRAVSGEEILEPYRKS